MTDRETILSDFKAQFLASIGTAGSHKGMPLTEAVKMFEKDWGKSVLSYLHLLGHSTTSELFAELEGDCVKLRNGVVYPVVKETNSHVFDLIDRTKKKKKLSKSTVTMSKYRNARFSASHHHLGGGGFTSFSKPIFPSNQKFSRSLIKSSNPCSALNSTRPVTKVGSLSSSASPKTNTTFDFSESTRSPNFSLFSEKKPPKMFACNEPAVDKSRNFSLNKPTKLFGAGDHVTPNDDHTKLPRSSCVVVTAGGRQRTITMSRHTVSIFTTSTPASKFSRSFGSPFTSSQPSSEGMDKASLPATYENTTPQVRELIALIHQNGGQMKLDDLQKAYLRRHDEVLTGTKLSTILQVNNKSHFVAFNAYRPKLFECTLAANTLMVRLLCCDVVLNKMRAFGELGLDSKKSASAVSFRSDASAATTAVASSNNLRPTSQTSDKPPTTSASSFFVYRTSRKSGVDERYARGSGYISDLTVSSGDEESATAAILRRYEPSSGSGACRSRDGVVAERLVNAPPFEYNRHKIGRAPPTMADVHKCIAGMEQQSSSGCFFDSAFVLERFEVNLVHIMMRMTLTKNQTKTIYNQERQLNV